MGQIHCIKKKKKSHAHIWPLSFSSQENEGCGFPLRLLHVKDLRDLDRAATVSTVTLCGHVGVVLF